MMQQWNCNEGMVQPVVCPTQYRCHDEFMPREVPYIHPIVNVNRQHIVEIPRHYYTETTQNVMGETLQAQPGFGPGPGSGPGFGPGPGSGPGFGPGPGSGPGFGPGSGPGFGPGPGCGPGPGFRPPRRRPRF